MAILTHKDSKKKKAVIFMTAFLEKLTGFSSLLFSVSEEYSHVQCQHASCHFLLI